MSHHVIPGGLSDRSLTSDTVWKNQSACRTVDGETFFDTTSTATTVARYVAAKEICRTCPVVKPCLAYVQGNPGRWSDYGVWGGLVPSEREDSDLVARVLEHGADAIPDLYFQWCAHCHTTKVYATAGRTPGSNWYCQQTACRKAAKGTPKPRTVAA